MTSLQTNQQMWCDQTEQSPASTVIILTWFWITMWSHNINFYTLPVLAQATCKSCYTDDLAQPGNPYNSHYWTRLETGRLLLLVLTRPGAQRKRSGGSSEDQQQQPDCRQPSPIMADVGTSHCSPKSCKVIVRKRLRYIFRSILEPALTLISTHFNFKYIRFGWRTDISTWLSH